MAKLVFFILSLIHHYSLTQTKRQPARLPHEEKLLGKRNAATKMASKTSAGEIRQRYFECIVPGLSNLQRALSRDEIF